MATALDHLFTLITAADRANSDGDSNNPVPVYQATVAQLPLDDVDEVTSDCLLALLLNAIVADTTTYRTALLHATLVVWSQLCDHPRGYSSYIRLWNQPLLAPGVLEAVDGCVADATPHNLFVELLNAVSDHTYSLILADALVAYYQPRTSFWVNLAATLNQAGDDSTFANHEIVTYIRLRNRQRPSWLRGPGPEHYTLSSAQITLLEDLSPPGLLARAMEIPFGADAHIGLAAYLLSATQNLAITTPGERVRLVGWPVPVCHRYEFDNEIFRAYGPTNAQHEDRGADGCDPYLECRMLTCNGYSEQLPNPEEDDELVRWDNPYAWFSGVCGSNKCERVIERARYAVREPLLLGGWRGCFCSWDCVRDHVDRNVLTDTNPPPSTDTARQTPAKHTGKILPSEAILVQELLNHAELQLLRYGLNDYQTNNVRSQSEQAHQKSHSPSAPLRQANHSRVGWYDPTETWGVDLPLMAPGNPTSPEWTINQLRMTALLNSHASLRDERETEREELSDQSRNT